MMLTLFVIIIYLKNNTAILHSMGEKNVVAVKGKLNTVTNTRLSKRCHGNLINDNSGQIQNSGKRLTQQKLLNVQSSRKQEVKTAPESSCTVKGIETPSSSGADGEQKAFASLSVSEKENSAAHENTKAHDLKKKPQNIIEIVSAFETHLIEYKQNKKDLSIISSKRKITPRIDKFFKYGKDAEDSSDNEFNPNPKRKRFQNAIRMRGDK